MKKLHKRREAKKLQSVIHAMAASAVVSAKKELEIVNKSTRQTGKTCTLAYYFINLTNVAYFGGLTTPTRVYLDKHLKTQHETIHKRINKSRRLS